MRYVYVCNGEICGEGTSEGNLPNGYSAIAIPDKFREVPLSELFLKNGKVKRRSTAPAGHAWDQEKEEWASPPPPAAFVDIWVQRIQALRGSEYWAILRQGAERTIKAQAAWSELYGILIAERNEVVLAEAIAAMLEALSPQLTEEEAAELYALLKTAPGSRGGG